jgi:hypothetical protein
MLGPVLRLACVTSPLLIALTSSRDHTHMHEARYLRFVCRDGFEVRSGEWLLLTSGKTQVIACVEEIGLRCGWEGVNSSASGARNAHHLPRGGNGPPL